MKKKKLEDILPKTNAKEQRTKKPKFVYLVKKIFMMLGHIFVYACMAVICIMVLYSIISAIDDEFISHETTEFTSYADFNKLGRLFSEELPNSANNIQYYDCWRGFLRIEKQAVKYTLSNEDFETLKVEKINQFNEFYDPENSNIEYFSFQENREDLKNSELYVGFLTFLDKMLDKNSNYRFLTYLKHRTNYIEYNGVIVDDGNKQVIEYYYRRYTN